MKTLGIIVLLIFISAFIVHCANALELVEGARQARENKTYAREQQIFAAHEMSKGEPSPVFWPAVHDSRFWLPEREWRKLYCAKYKAGACQ